MATAPPPPRGLLSTFRSFRHPNYRLYAAGQTVSLTGTWVQMTAQTWMAYELTGSSLWTTLVGSAQVLPTVLLGLFGGGLADRLPRRGLIQATQAAMMTLALLLAALTYLDVLTPGLLLLTATLVGVVNAIDTPARLAFVIDMVGRDDLPNAVALNSLLFNLARFAGPAAGGLVLARAGPAACFLLNAASFVAVLLALAAMRLPPRVARPAEQAAAGGLVAHLRANPPVALLLVLAGALAFFGWPLLSLLPAYADIVLGEGKAGYAALLSAVGLGALVGALVVAAAGRITRRRSFLAVGVIIGVGTLLGLAEVTTLSAASVLCALSGLGLILFFAMGQSVMQLSAGEHNRGAVMALWLTVLSAAQPAGTVAAGWMADRIGVVAVLRIQALGIAVVGVTMWIASVWVRRAIRRAGRPDPVTR